MVWPKWKLLFLPLGLLLSIWSHSKSTLDQLNVCTTFSVNHHLDLDAQTIRNLELFTPLNTNDTKGSLFSVINGTKTAMGARKLKQWCLHPLTDINAIHNRYDAIDVLKQDLLSREEIREQLQPIYDLERLTSAFYRKIITLET